MELHHRRFGELAERGDLATEDREQGGPSFQVIEAFRVIELQHIVARCLLRLGCSVIIERTDAGIGPAHILARYRPFEIFAHRREQVIGLGIRNPRCAWIAFMILVGGSDQRVVLLIGNGKADTAIAILEDVAAVVIVELVDHQMAALHHADFVGVIVAGDSSQHLTDPWSRRIDQGLGAQLFFRAILAGNCQLPHAINPPGGGTFRPCTDFSALGLRGAGIQHHQPGILHPTIGIFIATRELILQRVPDGIATQVNAAGWGQNLTPPQMIVEKQAEPQDRPRPEAVMMRQHEAQRPDDMRRCVEQHLAFDQGLAYQPELIVLEIAQSTMDEFGRTR